MFFQSLLTNFFISGFTNFYFLAYDSQTELLKETVLAYPQIYKLTQNGSQSGLKLLFVEVFKGTLFALVIVWANFYYFEGCSVNFLIFAMYTMLIIVSGLEGFSYVSRHYLRSSLTVLASCVSYFGYVFAFSGFYFNRERLTFDSARKIVLVPLCAWLPCFLAKKVYFRFVPDITSRLAQTWALMQHRKKVADSLHLSY